MIIKLSIQILAKRLEDAIEQRNINDIYDSLIYARPIFHTGEKTFNSNTLYMANAETLPAQAHFNEGSAILCIGTPPQVYFNCRLNLLIIGEEQDLFDINNKVHQIFDAFDLWDSGLKQSSGEWNPLQHMIDISEPVFGNGLSIMDSNYNIIAQTALNRTGYSGGLDEFGGISVDQVNSFKNDNAYAEIADEKEVFQFPADVLPFRCICKNIFLNEVFIFRIILSETTKSFDSSDASMFGHLASCLEDIPSRLSNSHPEESSVLASLFKNIAGGYSYNQSIFDKELNHLGWYHENTYRIMYIKPSSQDIYNMTMYYFCSKIMREYPQTFAFIDNSIIVVIVNISIIKISGDDFFAQFNYFIREGNFRVGFSNYFEGFKNLREYYIQARIALEIGLIQKPTVWTHTFADNMFLYMLNKITEELPADFLRSPVAARLQRYDEANQTEYLRTLTVYLGNHMNAAQSAKELFIHRATMLYRIDRIREIGKTDFKNPDELLHLQLSLRLDRN
ncbi:PucR C-terminal helix-turn-helix domain-containing protein [Parasporobacterium paucivorans DSM 15970]|uniref:PucR C-terminal helix-turn-helix domain-containing protein n=1 Tax=Parasporobacterium paucivorans DSM 15970 TaxID=1122934 RepID=A0A1M6L1Q3_9FIRM|nr:PucR C-terminal helix-turn-helix domain-containing protein [Parasporobacterium paucivorans DSM 15970]